MKKCNECNKFLKGRQKKWCSHICGVINWQRKNKEKVNEWKRNYVIKNRQKRLDSLKKYDTSEKSRNARKIWVSKNLERLREWARINSKKYRDRIIAQTQKRRAIIRNLNEHFTKEEWQALKKKYNFTCLMCKERESKIILSPDHVIPLLHGGKNTIDNIQPLCIRCNSVKNNKIIDYR